MITNSQIHSSVKQAYDDTENAGSYGNISNEDDVLDTEENVIIGAKQHLKDFYVNQSASSMVPKQILMLNQSIESNGTKSMFKNQSIRPILRVEPMLGRKIT